MKKPIIAIILMSLFSNVFAVSNIDTDLLEQGVVDNNYVYTNYEEAAAYFREMTNISAQLFPIKISYTTTISITSTPFYTRSIHQIDIPLTQTEKDNLKKVLLSKETIDGFCRAEYYPNQYMIANNHTLIYTYVDINYNKIVDVEINNRTCNE